MRDARVLCPDCGWSQPVESGTESFPYFCQKCPGLVRVDTEIETRNMDEYETKTDKL